jgi:hypothetical protein
MMRKEDGTCIRDTKQWITQSNHKKIVPVINFILKGVKRLFLLTIYENDILFIK